MFKRSSIFQPVESVSCIHCDTHFPLAAHLFCLNENALRQSVLIHLLILLKSVTDGLLASILYFCLRLALSAIRCEWKRINLARDKGVANCLKLISVASIFEHLLPHVKTPASHFKILNDGMEITLKLNFLYSKNRYKQ